MPHSLDSRTLKMIDQLRRAVILPAFFLIAVMFPYLMQVWGQEYFIGLASRMLVYGIAATSLNFILGYGGMVSFGHAAFLGLGAYVASILVVTGWSSALIAWPVAMLVTALGAFLIGLITLRTKGVYFIMITLAFAQMLYYVTISIKAYGGEEGLNVPRPSFPGLNLESDTEFYYVTLASVCAILYLMHRIINARFGRVLIAISENEVRMQSLGYKTMGYKLVAFVLAGSVAGLAGALLAAQNSFINPSIMHWTSSGLLLFMVTLGGIRSIYGGLIGAIAFLGLEDFAVNVQIDWLANLYPNYSQHSMLLVGVVLLVVVLFSPRGIAGFFANRGGHVHE